jgi:hypothetical protein
MRGREDKLEAADMNGTRMLALRRYLHQRGVPRHRDAASDLVP